jgi:PAS domain S-box-containing protein
MSAMTGPQPEKRNILLVGAGPELAGDVRTALTPLGYRVHIAATGGQALELAQEASFDIMLLDADLHDMDARQFCLHCREAEATRGLPILVLSPAVAPESIQELLSAGAADVLTAPLGLPLLRARVETHLQMIALKTELARRDALLEEEAATLRQVEESVRIAEMSGRELVENLSEVIYTAGLDGILTYVSPGVERLLGYTPQEAVGRHVSDFVHPKAHSSLSARIERVAAGQREANEYRFVTKTGATRWAQSSSQPIIEDGQVIGLQGVLTDITERKQAEERIRQQNEFLTTVIESLTHPFYVLNVDDYTIQMANTAAQVEGLQGSATCYALTHRRDVPCDSNDHPCPIEELRKTGKPVRVEHVHYDPGGRERYVEVHSYPLFDDQGRLVRAIEYTLDITERKQAEELLRESEARWRSVTENSPDHVMLLDSDLKIQFVNYPSPGLTLDQLLGTPLYAYVDEEYQQDVKETLQRVLNSSEAASYETSYSTPDGDSIYYESRVVPRLVEGQIVGLAVNARDITEHKRAEQALREAMEAAEQARQAEQERRREADQRRRVAESLAGVMDALNSNQPLEHVLDHIAAQARELLNNEEVAIYRLAHNGDELILQAAQGPVRADLRAIERACKLEKITQALSARKPLIINDLKALSLQGEKRLSQSFRAVLIVPVMVQSATYGGIVMCSIEPRNFSDDEVELAAIFANQVALAVESARLRSQREQAAAAAERNRLARELHDSVTQALFSATLVAEVLPQVGERDPELAREGLLELGALTRGALAEMRTMLLELRPTALVETRLSDLIEQLTDAVTGRVGLLASYNIEPSPALPPDVHITFYRIAQEALNNVLKHAKAKRVNVSLVAAPPVDSEADGNWQGQIVLAVADDGHGFEQRGPGPDKLGLEIMRERAETIGAELSIESQLDEGTRVTLIWPREDTAADE